MAKHPKIKKRPSASVQRTRKNDIAKEVQTKKRPAQAKKGTTTTGSGKKQPRWKAFKVSSGFVSSTFRIESIHDKLESDIKRQEEQQPENGVVGTSKHLQIAKDRLVDLERKLSRIREKDTKARGKPTGRLVDVSIECLPVAISVSGRLLSGEIAMTANMPMDATIGDLEMQVSQTLGWMFADSFDHEGNMVPKHLEIKGLSVIVMKELALREVQGVFPPLGLSESMRQSLAFDFFTEHTLPIRYAQVEHWEDGQGVGGDGDLALDFRTSKSRSLLKFGKLFNLQDELGWKHCERLASSAKYNTGPQSSLDYFLMMDRSHVYFIKGRSQLEIVEDELRLHEILTCLADEADAFVKTPFDSVTGGEDPGGPITDVVEFLRRQTESRLVMKAALHWIERFCTSSSASAVYVRLEQWRRTYHNESDEEFFGGDDEEKPGRSIVEATGVLFIRADNGVIARLSLKKNLDDFAGCC